MGYYTYYSLNYHSDNAEHLKFDYIEKMAARLGEISGYWDVEDLKGYLNAFDILRAESMKWYDYDADMLRLSAEFPDMWFELYGDGEDPDDRWRAVYHNGKASYSRGYWYYDDYDDSVFKEENPFR